MSAASFWRTLAVLAAATLLAQVANSQRRVSMPQTTTFTAPDRAFQFSYPSGYQICTAGKIEPCAQSYIPVCEDDALVCVLYPDKQLEDTNLSDVSFQVREIHRDQLMTADVCATPYPEEGSKWPEFQVSAKHPTEMIGGVRFLHGGSGGVATGHWSDTEVYRAFHRERCFELSISQSGTDPSLSDPPLEPITPARQKTLDRSTSQILHSFRFLN